MTCIYRCGWARSSQGRRWSARCNFRQGTWQATRSLARAGATWSWSAGQALNDRR